MNQLKKIATITLFLTLIASLILFKSDILRYDKKDDASILIASNFSFSKDSLEKDKRLLIDYTLHLDINNSGLTVEKRVVKTFTLETWDTQMISSSKSFIVQKRFETPKYATKNEDIIKKLEQFNIKRVRFTSNKYLDGISNDEDLLELINFVDNKVLKSNKSLEKHLTNQNEVNVYWNRYNNSQVDVHNFNKPIGVYIDREKVDEFLKWYSRLEAKRRADKNKKFKIMTSSKSATVVDMSKIRLSDPSKPSPEYLEEKKLFKKKLKEYLDIEF